MSIKGCINEKVSINPRVNLNSNANLEVVNGLISRLMLKEMSIELSGGLRKLVACRNSLAHGDEGFPITQKDIDFYSKTILDASAELVFSVSDGYKSGVYRQGLNNG